MKSTDCYKRQGMGGYGKMSVSIWLYQFQEQWTATGWIDRVINWFERHRVKVMSKQNHRKKIFVFRPYLKNALY